MSMHYYRCVLIPKWYVGLLIPCLRVLKPKWVELTQNQVVLIQCLRGEVAVVVQHSVGPRQVVFLQIL